MARSKKSITPPMRKKPPFRRDSYQPFLFFYAPQLQQGVCLPPEQNTTPISVHQVSLERHGFQTGSSVSSDGHTEARVPGHNILWVSDSHIDILAVCSRFDVGVPRKARL